MYSKILSFTDAFPNRPALPTVIRVGAREIPITERDVERFFAKVRITGPEECWEWTAGQGTGGYGSFRLGPKPGTDIHAHRFAYTALIGQIPGGLQLDHLCRNRGCINPAHLEPVTLAENVLRGAGITAAHAAQTHCIHGHAFDEKNTRMRPSGGRDCRTCARDKRREYRAAERGDALVCGAVTRSGGVCIRPAGHDSRHYTRTN